MTRSRYRIFEEAFPYFLTCTTVAWLPVFSQPAFAETVLDSWRFLQRERSIRIHAYVILENHLHWIASGEGLSQKLGQFKSFTARVILDAVRDRRYATLLEELRYFKQRHKTDQDLQLWQEGNHPQQIQNDEMMWQKIEYIHNNPVRRGYVDDPTHWCYSSARTYAGQKGLIEIDMSWR